MARHSDPELEDRILQAARKLWHDGGEEALSMRAVAKAAGTNTPAVYMRWLEVLATDRRGLTGGGSILGRCDQARWSPPSSFRAEMVVVDQSLTSSSRKVRSCDWNFARSRME